MLTVAVIGYSTFGLGVWVESSIRAGAAGELYAHTAKNQFSSFSGSPSPKVISAVRTRFHFCCTMRTEAAMFAV